MNPIRYDMSVLAEFSEFDAKSAAKSLGSYQSYFDRLTHFIDYHSYLRGYTASVIIYNEDMRAKFLAELSETQDALLSLGMAGKSLQLDYLIEAIHKKDADTLSDGMMTFCVEMDDFAERIASARLTDDDRSTAETDSAIPTQVREKPVILAVDDKPELLTTITSVLQSKYRVIAVTNSSSALKAIEAHYPALFLLDIEMPVMNGYELAEKIRENNKFKKTPILFFTSKATREHVIGAISHGGNDYIVKPVDKDVLLKKIELHLRGKG